MGAYLKPGILIENVGADLMIMDVQSGNYFSLNATGARMLRLLIAGADFVHVIQAMQAEFSVGASVLQADLERLVNELCAKQLLSFQAQDAGNGDSHD
jgi:hypothetical protein